MTGATFGALTITAGDGRRAMDPGDGLYRRHYSVRVTSDATGERVRFDFHGSAADEKAGKTGLGPDDLLWAFRCFVSDAEAGGSSFEDFALDFGYDVDSYSARQTWAACKSARRRFGRLYSDGRDPADVLEALAMAGVE